MIENDPLPESRTTGEDPVWASLDLTLRSREIGAADGELQQLAFDDAPPMAVERPSIAAPDDQLIARFKAASCTRPLHQLEQRRGQRGWEEYGLFELALQAVDLVVERMELSDGIHPDELREALTAAAALQRPADPSATHAAVADGVLAALLEPLDTQYGTIAASGAYERHAWSTRLVEEIQTFDGAFQLRAGRAAVNVLVGALDLEDLESAQAATEAALESLLARKRFVVALRQANNARRLSKSYAEDIRKLVAAAERSVRNVSWDETIRPQLQAAYAHLDERVTAEATITHRLEDLPDDASKGLEVQRVIDALRDCLRRHQELHTAVLHAQQRLLDEQAEQAFRPPPIADLPDLERHVLRPLLGLTLQDAGSVLDAAFASFARPRAPRRPGLGPLLARMLAPERQPASRLGAEIVDGELDDRLEERFSPEARDAAARAIDAAPDGSQLSALVEGLDGEAARLATLIALGAMDPDVAPSALLATPVASSSPPVTNASVASSSASAAEVPAAATPDGELSRRLSFGGSVTGDELLLHRIPSSPGGPRP